MSEPFGGGYVREIRLLYSESATRGMGVQGDPVRIVKQLWTPEGALIAECDAWSNESWYDPTRERTTEGQSR